jgi:hypothetical protein
MILDHPRHHRDFSQSFSTDRSAPGGGPSATMTAGDGAVARTAVAIAESRMRGAKLRENIIGLTDQMSGLTLLYCCNPIQMARPER